MATCSRCNAIITPDDAAFCGICGAPLAPPEAPRPRRPATLLRTVPEAPISAAVKPVEAPPVEAPTTSAVVPGLPAGAPGTRRLPAKHLPLGTVIDQKYEIERVLGEGGMGVVYLARDIHTGVDVVLKSVRSELSHRGGVRERTLTEGRVLAQIDHPNVVHLKAVVVDDRSLWLVMQYIEGESLDRTIERNVEQKKQMPLGEALRLFRQIASGIAAAHAEGIIHRDLKPANVLLRKKDHVAKVTDFGIAKAEHDDGTGRVQTRGVIGSIWYMSPEQVTGRRDLDKRVDIYALGVVLYQMLTGKVPFDAESDYEIMRAQAETPMPRARDLRPDLPESVDALLQKLCAKKRDERFATCEDVLTEVSAIEAEIAVKPTPAPATQLPRDAQARPLSPTGVPAKSVVEEDAKDPPPKDGTAAPTCIISRTTLNARSVTCAVPSRSSPRSSGRTGRVRVSISPEHPSTPH